MTAISLPPIAVQAVRFDLIGDSPLMDSGSLPTGTIAVTAGASSATLTVALDDTATPGRTLILTLAAGTGYSVGTPSSATGTIV